MWCWKILFPKYLEEKSLGEGIIIVKANLGERFTKDHVNIVCLSSKKKKY